MRGCRHARRRILLAADDRLPLEERFLLEEHVATCRSCGELQAASLILGEALQEQPGPTTGGFDLERAVSAVRSGVEARGTSRNAPRRRVARLVPLGLAAAACVLFFFQRTDEDVPQQVQVIVDESGPPSQVDVGPGTVPRDATLAEVELEVREHLLRSFAGVAPGADVSDAVQQFDELTRLLRRQGWPVDRICQRWIASPEPEIARTAARAVGVRRDRVALASLVAALERPEIAPDVLAALGDLGPAGVPELARRLRDPELAESALEHLTRAGGTRAAVALEAELLAPPASAELERALLDALAAADADPLERMLRVAYARPELAELAFARLGHVEHVDDAFARLVARPDLPFPVEYLLRAAAAFEPPSGLAWLEQLSEEYRHRAAALASLAEWRGEGPLAVLLRLDASGRVPEAELIDTLNAVLALDSSRAATFARELVSTDSREAEAEGLLGLLLAGADPGASSALVVLALSESISDDGRQWAALAIGSLGNEGDAWRLARGVATLRPEDRRLFAACLVSIHTLLGEEGVWAALERFAPAATRRVLTALDETAERGDSAGLHRVARAVNAAVLYQNSKYWDSAL